MKYTVILVLGILFSCTSIDYDNPIDKNGTNYSHVIDTNIDSSNISVNQDTSDTNISDTAQNSDDNNGDTTVVDTTTNDTTNTEIPKDTTKNLDTTSVEVEKGLVFDGETSYTFAGADCEQINVVSVWIYMTTKNTNGKIFYKGEQNSGDYLEVSIFDGKARIIIKTSNVAGGDFVYITDKNTLPLNKLVNIILVRNEKNVKLFVNKNQINGEVYINGTITSGNEVDANIPYISTQGLPIIIGDLQRNNYIDNHSYFDGIVDQISIYDTYPNDVSSFISNIYDKKESNFISIWKFNDNLEDETGKNSIIETGNEVYQEIQ